MQPKEQKDFLIDLAAAVMLRDLIIYRTGIEYFKRNPADSFNGVENIMSQIRRDPTVRGQLSEDFKAYLDGVLALDKADPREVFEKFVTEWFPRSAAN